MEISHFPFSVDIFLLDSNTVPKSSWQMTDIQVIDDSDVQEFILQEPMTKSQRGWSLIFLIQVSIILNLPARI